MTSFRVMFIASWMLLKMKTRKWYCLGTLVEILTRVKELGVTTF